VDGAAGGEAVGGTSCAVGVVKGDKEGGAEVGSLEGLGSLAGLGEKPGLSGDRRRRRRWLLW
jgi:hypothetical protein